MRIISVVPSLTELLFDLGLDEHIVGVTRFCIHPKNKIKSKQKVGGTKNLKIERILELSPTLIIANKEENAKADIEELQKSYTVLLTDIYSLEDALKSILTIGELTQSNIEAGLLVQKIQSEFDAYIPNNKLQGKKVAYLIWNDPIMICGRNTFINILIEKMGMKNVFPQIDGRYPQINESQLHLLEPDCIFLSSEPFPFKNKHLVDFQKRFPKTKVSLVDGEMFSWYGSRLKLVPEYLTKLQKELIISC